MCQQVSLDGISYNGDLIGKLKTEIASISLKVAFQKSICTHLKGTVYSKPIVLVWGGGGGIGVKTAHE